jgi:hypothetical protein
MQDDRAKVELKKQDGRAKKCKAVEQKLNKKYKIPSKEMQDGRA